MEKRRIKGTICDVINHGTIVEVVAKSAEDAEQSVYFEHRMFYNMLDALFGANIPLKESLLGLEVEYDEQYFQVQNEKEQSYPQENIGSGSAGRFGFIPELRLLP